MFCLVVVSTAMFFVFRKLPAGFVFLLGPHIFGQGVCMSLLRKGNDFVKDWMFDNCRIVCVDDLGSTTLNACTKFLTDVAQRCSGQVRLYTCLQFQILGRAGFVLKLKSSG